MQPLASIADGPRGRRFLMSLLAERDEQLASEVMREAIAADSSTGSAHVVFSKVDESDPGIDRSPVTPVSPAQRIRDQDADIAGADLLAALAEATRTAMYWQEEDGEDQVLARPDIADALAGFARALEPALSATWLVEPLDAPAQFFVQWLGKHPTSELEMSGADAKLRAWKSGTVAGERRADAEWPKSPGAPWTGEWWSTPALTELPITTRALPQTGPVRLQLIEDTLGWTEALAAPVRAGEGIRVYELSAPDAWIRLVERYALRVTNSRRHDWWRVTGIESEWFIPDWEAVAADFDAVHLSATGYLATAGRALPVNGGHTVLAGWGPDEAYWLTDALVEAGQPVEWHASLDGALWWPREAEKKPWT
ncbi:hypothetical protein [Cryobacterium sp. BB307]|uniref:hypothetical protein n=1 Tax=Cryobacterium sp. BB307 TaxID=2716317 RepID=UPI00144693F9|nr:hypothetical protein [Cryobacterium sp. BB307]